MSDFDHKNIPTLDDIIDVEVNETAEPDPNEEIDSPDLFEADDIDSEDAAEDMLNESKIPAAETSFSDSGLVQHHLQHNYEEIYSGLVYPFSHATTNENTDEPNSKLPLDTLALEKIVGNVVKQILPDIEQQLRFLIHRSLEEKLPEEIDKFTNEDADS